MKMPEKLNSVLMVESEIIEKVLMRMVMMMVNICVSSATLSIHMYYLIHLSNSPVGCYFYILSLEKFKQKRLTSLPQTVHLIEGRVGI